MLYWSRSRVCDEQKLMGRAELQISRIRAGVIRYKVYKEDHEALVDEVHFPEGGKMKITLKLDFSFTNQDQIWNQRC